MVIRIAQEVKEVHCLGVEVALVVGGGNIFRGLQASAGHGPRLRRLMGMLATVMNAIALQDALEKLDVFTRVVRDRDARNRRAFHPPPRHPPHRKGRVVIFAAGIGQPFFTTDTAAAMRALEIQADVIMKATRVGGVFTADPRKDPNAVKIDELS